MARITYGAIATEIRGSIGGTTFQKNAYGFTVKNKPNMVFPNSSAQNNIKRAVVRCTQRWGNLTSTQQGDWNTYASSFPQYAKHNSGSRLSGYNVFLKRNMIAEIIDTFRLDDPDLTAVDNSTYAPTAAVSGGLFTITLNPTPAIGDIDLILFASAPSPASKPIRRNQMRFISGFGGLGTSVEISTQYTNIWGRIPVSGEKVLFSFQNIGDLTGVVYANQYFNLIVS